MNIGPTGVSAATIVVCGVRPHRRPVLCEIDVVAVADDRCIRLLGEAIFSPGHPDPYPLYRELRQVAPVLETPAGAVALSWQACEGILRDRQFSSRPIEPWPDPGSGRVEQQAWARRWSIYRDPPDHTAIRSLFSRVFTPRRVESLRPYVRQLLDGYLRPGAERGDIELISEVALPLPITVVGELIGIPRADRSKFRDWSQAILRPIGDIAASTEVVAAAEQATLDVRDFMIELIAERRRVPQDDLISDLLKLGDENLSVAQDDLLANLQFLMSAGFETTVFTIGNAIKALTDHPDQLHFLRHRPEVIRHATEELLRFETPVVFPNPRRATADTDIAGTFIKAGTLVTILPGAANRDPAQFQDPERLDLHRENVQALSFGSGIHFCLGAALARLEIQEALMALTRFSSLERTEEVEWTQSVVFRGPQRLTLQLGL